MKNKKMACALLIITFAAIIFEQNIATHSERKATYNNFYIPHEETPHFTDFIEKELRC